MAKRQPRKQVVADKREGQITVHGGPAANYFLRNVPIWNPPSWQGAEMWRNFVMRQPIALICRDTIANYLNSLDWAIVARDSDQRDELRETVKYYTRLLERGSTYYYDMDFASHVEWIVKDLYDLPFGAASEIGRVDDNPEGDVVWIRPLDGGTCAPTLNFDYPVVQIAQTAGVLPVYLPREFVSRIFLSPRTELQREGWGIAPPERIARAIEMLSNGDNYYAQLILNTPEAGILDLGDMEKESAENWVKSLQDLLYGIHPLKIPVLYEHTTQAKWIPFGKPPSEIMYDTTTTKYAAIVAAGYGLTLSDIGFPTQTGGGDTLAGTIRMERVAKSSGKAIAKKKLEFYFNRILPDTLKFTWIDYDDERNVSKGRARLASAQAADIFVRNKILTPMEIRQQTLADGLISISIPETIDINDESLFPATASFGQFGGSRTKTLGNPVAPSEGGQGEIIPQQIIQRNMANAEVGISKAAYQVSEILGELLRKARENLSGAEMEVWNMYVDDYLAGKSDVEEDALKGVLDDILQRVRSAIVNQAWISEFAGEIAKKMPEKSSVEGVKSILADKIARMATILMRSKMADLRVDATESVNNNIRVSRETSVEVVKSFPRIVNSAYEDGVILARTGEQDAN